MLGDKLGDQLLLVVHNVLEEDELLLFVCAMLDDQLEDELLLVHRAVLDDQLLLIVRVVLGRQLEDQLLLLACATQDNKLVDKLTFVVHAVLDDQRLLVIHAVLDNQLLLVVHPVLDNSPGAAADAAGVSPSLSSPRPCRLVLAALSLPPCPCHLGRLILATLSSGWLLCPCRLAASSSPHP